MAALAGADEFHAGAGVRAAFSTIRKHIEFMTRDRAMDLDVQKVCALVAEGALITGRA